MLCHPRISGPVPYRRDLPADIRNRLLDRAFRLMDERKVSLEDQYQWISEKCPVLIPRISGGSPAPTYMVYNSSLATTVAPVSQPTGTAIRTMMQLKVGAGQSLRIVEWGISYDGTSANTPGKVELFETTVAATMSTAYVNADITRYTDGTGPQQGDTTLTPIDVTGTATAGFATAAVTEGTVANMRMCDMQLGPPTGPFVKQFPLGREPGLVAGRFLRCRVTFGTTVNVWIYVIFES